MTLRQPQGAVVWGALQKSTELGSQQHHTSMPTYAGSPFIFTLSRGGESTLGTPGTQSNQLTLSHSGPPGKGQRNPVQSKKPFESVPRPLPPKNMVKEQMNSKFTDQRLWPNSSPREKQHLELESFSHDSFLSPFNFFHFFFFPFQLLFFMLATLNLSIFS